MKFTRLLLTTIAIVFCNAAFAQILINEISTRGTVLSAAGNESDWIELYNAGGTVVNLNGYGLSDDAVYLNKWIFPDININPGEHILVVASGDNNGDLINHWESAINYNDVWRYRSNTSAPPSDWNTNSFDDSGWSTGEGSIGYGDGDDNTYISSTYSICMRKTFDADPDILAKAVLYADYDDGFVAYLNGVEIARSSNMIGTTPTYNSGTTVDHEAVLYWGGVPEAFEIPDAIFSAALLPGENVLAIQVNNLNYYSSDFSSLFWLSFGITTTDNPYGDVPPWFAYGSTYLETNFKISTAGETIYLSDNAGNILDQKFTGYLDVHNSIARIPDGSAWCVTANETPETTNDFATCTGGYEPAPVFSLAPGFYSGSQTIELTSTSATAEIHYTLDGSHVDVSSPIYSDPITIDTTCVVAAKCFSSSTLLPSPMIKNTYFLDEGDFGINVISISTDPGSLWDNDTGIYVFGDSYEAWYPYFGANFWEPWEKLAHVSYYDMDGNALFEHQMMLEIHGGYSRAEDKRGFRLDFKNSLDGDLQYAIFADKPEVNTFNNLNLRNGGQHIWYSIIQDSYLARVMRNTYIDYEAYTPVHVFLNGDYWGLYEVREKADEHFVESNYGNDADDIDLLNGWTALAGSDTGFVNMYNWLMDHSVDDADFYNYFADRVDVQNYVDYYIGEIYYQNSDFGGAYWGQNNIKLYRDRTGGKWRHIMYDMDGAMGWFGGSVWDNFIDIIRNPAGTSMNSEIFDKMLDNEEFRNYFINRFADLINTIWQNDYMEEVMIEMRSQLINEIQRTADRWGPPYNALTWVDYTQWILDYNADRITPARYQIKSSFDLTQQRFITLQVNPPEAGYIQISTIIPQDLPWEGVYFEDVPLTITAIPNPGYTFSNWTTVDVIPAGEELNQSVTLFLNSSETFEANFTGAAIEPEIIITEINYNSENSASSGDWFELFNNGSDAIDISGWQVADATGVNTFHIPSPTILEPNAYLVLSNDLESFSTKNPTVENVIGELNFKLNNIGDRIALIALNGDTISNVVFADSSGWPQGADGTGRTLELKNYFGDQNDPTNWFDGCMFGSPGVAYSPCNEILVFSEINYNSADTANAGDWVEILNTSPITLDMSLWKFADRNDSLVYQIPPGTMLPSDNRLIIANNSALFNERHADIDPLTTNFMFGLDASGDVLRLYDNNGVIQFSVIYNDELPWPTEADGGGKTLELADITGIMNDASNWFAGCPEGSPGIAYDPDCGVVVFINDPALSVSVYPNPADDYFIVESDIAILSLEIMDLSGKVIYEMTANNSLKTIIPTSYLDNGFYLMKLHFEQGERILKFIVQHK